tara:strand:- start:266 stop:706 length:441 start_codon:yes stop_codon:yes gene_type:complete
LIIAIDAGVRKCGLAFFSPGGELLGALTVKNPEQTLKGVAAWRAMVDAVYSSIMAPELLIIETMQNDGRVITDALDVQLVAGIIIGRAACTVITYTPRVWKGQVPKSATMARIKRDLTPEELARIDDKATHDAYDAIGIGRFYFSN